MPEYKVTGTYRGPENRFYYPGDVVKLAEDIAKNLPVELIIEKPKKEERPKDKKVKK